MPKPRAQVLREIVDDCRSDATNLDGQPFTGRTVAEAFGNTLAMVAALARIVETLLPDEEREAERERIAGEGV